MRDFVDDYIASISARRRRRIYDLLSDAQLHKRDLEALVEKLNDIRRLSPIAIKDEIPGAPVEGGKLEATFRDVHTNLSELYGISNLISGVLFNNMSTLTSEIKEVEDELTAMSKMVENYAFGLSDNGSYDYSYIETFSDEVMKEQFSYPLSDRNGVNFNTDEMAVVNTSSGVLTLSPDLKISYGLSGIVINNNCLGFATSNTGMEKALDRSIGTGWRVAVSAPRAISSTLIPGTKPGAQVHLEFFLQNPSPCDTLILAPFSDLPIEINSFKIYADNSNSDATEVLATPHIIDRPTNFNFTMQPVSRFAIIVSQPVYKRKSILVDKHETQYRSLVQNVENDRLEYERIKQKPYKRNRKVLRHVLLRSQEKTSNFPGFFRSIAPQVDFDVANGPLSLDRLLYKRQSTSGDDVLWRSSSKTQTLIRRMIMERMFAGNVDVMPERIVLSRSNAYMGSAPPMLNRTGESYAHQGYPRSPNLEPPPNAFMVAGEDLGSETSMNYEYDLGFRNIEIGTGMSVYRGVFISKTLPAFSDSGEVRIKVSDTNYAIYNAPRDSAVVTSVEYSITNRSTPQKESDWVPILSVDQTTVVAERFFVGQTGIGYFRFPASLSGNVTLYKNGYRILLDEDTAYIYSPGKRTILGLTLPIDSIGNTDIFTCDYTPSGDPTTINFENIGFGQSVLASAYDSSGAGQTFSGTTQDRAVVLIYEPYVDYDQVNAVSYYGDAGFGGTYQPLTVQMADGTVAVNQTNYRGFRQNSLADYADSSTIYYIHSGKNIIFNKVITQDFTVFYQYLPSNLRFRTILRVNDLAFVTPVVDSVQVKSKTRQANRRKIF